MSVCLCACICVCLDVYTYADILSVFSEECYNNVCIRCGESCCIHSTGQ